MKKRYPNRKTNWKPHLKLIDGEWHVFIGDYTNWLLASYAQAYCQFKNR